MQCCADRVVTLSMHVAMIPCVSQDINPCQPAKYRHGGHGLISLGTKPFYFKPFLCFCMTWHGTTSAAISIGSSVIAKEFHHYQLDNSSITFNHNSILD